MYYLSIKKIKHEKKVEMNFQTLLYFSFISVALILAIKLFISQNNLSHSIFELLFHLISYAIFQVVI